MVCSSSEIPYLGDLFLDQPHICRQGRRTYIPFPIPPGPVHFCHPHLALQQFRHGYSPGHHLVPNMLLLSPHLSFWILLPLFPSLSLSPLFFLTLSPFLGFLSCSLLHFLLLLLLLLPMLPKHGYLPFVMCELCFKVSILEGGKDDGSQK